MTSSPNRRKKALNSRIEICGGIASGKTTLATILGRYLTPAAFVFEDFQGNPFWKAFYSDPIGSAFETELTFLLQHYHNIKNAAKKCALVACDFSLLLDSAYAHVTLDNGKLAAFRTVYKEIQAELPPPDLIIHLACSPAIELARIRQRGREEEQSITSEYLEAINFALCVVIGEEARPGQVLKINSGELDFAYDDSDKKRVCELVLARLKSTTGESV